MNKTAVVTAMLAITIATAYASTPVNQQITDTVTQSNVKAVSEAQAAPQTNALSDNTTYVYPTKTPTPSEYFNSIQTGEILSAPEMLREE
ncbi:MAG: hypothetical protein CMF39_03285 [Legionellaceae bacterium]|nr:hypothetical protein [Legionellaceae bacterium]|tara:strand:- start:177 stop:446 length:270 start_codon:yes stop_codon:yes gene_type:complete